MRRVSNEDHCRVGTKLGADRGAMHGGGDTSAGFFLRLVRRRSVGDLVLGRSVHDGTLAAWIAEHESQKQGARTCDVSVPFLSSSVVAHVFVNSEERIQQIEIRLPLARFGEVKHQLIQKFGRPKSDSTSPSVDGLAAWERRDMETAVGLFSESEHDSTLLVVFIWIASDADHAQIAVENDRSSGKKQGNMTQIFMAGI